MNLEKRLQQLANDVSPTSEQQMRIRNILLRRIDGPVMLAQAKKEATPHSTLKHALWNHVIEIINAPAVSSLFDHIRALLHPSPDVQSRLRISLFERLAPPIPIPFAQRFYKWGAAFIIVVLALRASPILFLTPQTVAHSSVLLSPTPTGVELSAHGLWQSVTQELVLSDAVSLRTNDGEATIMLHDDGNVRLASQTAITLEDVSDHLTSASESTTLTIASGKIWLQGLLSDQLRGFVIATPAGDVIVHGGSVSIEVTDEKTHIEVWDRHATVTYDDQMVSLVAGEYVELSQGSASVVRELSADAYKAPWTAQNLRRDAVHQREMAQLQQERRAAEAGILPTSPFYTVKRVAESFDVLLTLDPEVKVQKRLQQASTRLNEAAALIAHGDSGASVPLDEYKQTLIEVASGSGDTATQTLVRQQITENTAQLSAASPDEQFYQLKKTVLEASAELQDDLVDQRDVSGTLLVDTLDVLQQAILDQDTEQVTVTLETLKPYLSSLQTGSGETLKPEVRKEALSLLSDVAEGLQDTEGGSGATALSSDLAEQIADYLPVEEEEKSHVVPVVVQAPPMTEAEVAAAVQDTLHRIFVVYKMPKSRENALRVDIRSFIGSPDEGRYLRRLYHELPPGDSILRLLVRHAIQRLNEKQIVQGILDGSGSGQTEE